MNAAAVLAVLPQIISLISQAAQMATASGAVVKYLDLLAVLVQSGAQAYDGLAKLRQLVADMVAQQREPTDIEWAALLARSDAAHEAIQAADTTDAPVPPVEGDIK